MKKKVVLAFSGGLDTSFCVPFLKEQGYEVHTVMVNTGGFSEEEEKSIEERALDLGAASHKTVDAVDTYYHKGIRYLIYGNILKNATYPLSVSSERVFQALEVLKHVKEIGADAVAHGSTGAGNDQVRFDIVFEVLAPEVESIAPFREHGFTRQYEIDFLQKHGFNFTWEKARYSINQGLWVQVSEAWKHCLLMVISRKRHIRQRSPRQDLNTSRSDSERESRFHSMELR